jgi:hypothetical protein
MLEYSDFLAMLVMVFYADFYIFAFWIIRDDDTFGRVDCHSIARIKFFYYLYHFFELFQAICDQHCVIAESRKWDLEGSISRKDVSKIAMIISMISLSKP